MRWGRASALKARPAIRAGQIRPRSVPRPPALTLLLAFVLALLVCVPARAEDDRFPRVQAETVLAEAFSAIIERHLTAVAPNDLLLWSLRGLTALDAGITGEIAEGRLTLRSGGAPIAAQVLLGAASLPQALARSMAAMLGAGWVASAAVREAGFERVLQSSLEEVFNHLDPYSRYVTAEEAAIARERRIGQRGLGLRLAIGPRRSVVLATVAPGGPAALSRLRPGDRLLEIDGVRVSAEDLPDAAARLEGPTGGAVTLTLARGNQRMRVSLLRAPVPPETVTSERRDGILYLRLSAFSQGSASQLVGALTDASLAGAPRGYVLDLRGNRGGLLPQAAAVADVFLQSGEILRTEGRHPDSGRSWIASGGDLAQGRPLVVLVDGRTASSAEAVAATLGDRGRAVLVGSGTTGKGLVQIVIPLPNGAELLVSWSRLIAPQGWPIQSLGVMPNLCTSLGEEATGAALLMLAEGETPMAVPVARLRAARAPVSPEDAQRLRAPCPAAEGRDADMSAARALIARHNLYRTALQP
ncbi:MAG: hypothetical protein JWO24_2960 [Rhodospirillales bacterium]|nr:hypothetical protein [Rhodospirillales bacterium]